MSIVALNRLGFRYPDTEQWIFRDLSLSVSKGEFVAIVGGSGVGKSTVLRMVAGLISPQTGSVVLDTQRRAGCRRRALVFQDGRLMPWRTVARNVELGLEGLELQGKEKAGRVQDALALTGLATFADRWPYQLSGGQVQRVGIARALAVQPDILLMDEPFSAVDAITRRRLQDELVGIWQRSRTAIMFVTHDIEEAVFLADRIVVLGGSPARIKSETIVTVDRNYRRSTSEISGLVDDIAAQLED